MERAKIIASIAESEEDRILLARVYERIQMGYSRNVLTSTCFLTEREQALSERLLRGEGMTEFTFFGGFDSAERKICLHLPDYLEPELLYEDDSPLTSIRATYFEQDALTHRDFLGALMGCGVKRETVGDILVGVGCCDFLILKEIAPYISQNFISAGRTKLSLEEIRLRDLSVPQLEIEEISDTVATLRLDSVIASGYRQSRGKAAALIEAGRASVNHLPCIKGDKQLSEGDIVTVKGLGKICLKTVRGQTKKGRVSIIIERYR